MGKNIKEILEQKDCSKKKKDCKNILIFKSKKIIDQSRCASNIDGTFKNNQGISLVDGVKQRNFRN